MGLKLRSKVAPESIPWASGTPCCLHVRKVVCLGAVAWCGRRGRSLARGVVGAGGCLHVWRELQGTLTTGKGL